MKSLAVARHAMATRFEILLHGPNEVGLRAAAEEALNEIQRWEAQLSLYEPTSAISLLNARAAATPIRVEPEIFRLLQLAARLSEATGGAFDVTVAPLMRCWGFMRGSGRLPEPSMLAEARSRVGMRNVIFNEADFTIRFAIEGVMLDLGSVGKGYALERAAELLVEAGVTSALLHGGTSTVQAIGAPPDAESWKVAVPHPRMGGANLGIDSPGAGSEILAVIPLRDEALSVSAVWGKAFEADGRIYGHVIDPRKGEPVTGAVMAAVVLKSAAETDAFSTALLTLGPPGHDQVAKLRPGMRTVLVTPGMAPGEFHVESRGIETAF